MILTFNGREIDTEEYELSFDEACCVNSDEATFQDAMEAMDITFEEVDFSNNAGEDGLPEEEIDPIGAQIITWVDHYNQKVLDPYNDKETNILINDMGEDGLQLLYLYCYDAAADSDENEEQFESLNFLFKKMRKDQKAYNTVGTTVNEYQDNELGPNETYLLLKIRFTDTTV